MAEGGQRESSELKEQATNEHENEDMSQETSSKQEENPERNSSSISTTEDKGQKGMTDREEKTTNLTDTDCITVLPFESDKDQSYEENTDEYHRASPTICVFSSYALFHL